MRSGSPRPRVPVDRGPTAIAARAGAPVRVVLVPLADLRAERLIEALTRPDKAARRAVQTVPGAPVAEAGPHRDADGTVRPA